MEALVSPELGFIVIFLAALFLFGEFLVRAKGLFGLIGCLLFVYYFAYHLTNQSSTYVVGLLIAGIVLIIIDGKLLVNGSVAAVGLLLMIISCALPAPTFFYGTLVSIAFIIGVSCSFFFLKYMPRKMYWSKLLLKDQLSTEKGYNSINESYQFLVGKEGIATTPFRPVGTIKIEGKLYSAVTNGVWIESESKIKVISVDGTKILIEKI
ncbi:nodulation protein NfeD [Terrilactibacillus sp. BCM23-1]|uniref:Nodulation protein NfeD n=1 Tax=Terrilactibacillus tamarindi TaxID=2599694 RepID=A0A6N8CSL1_9BACI|nr:NfeD family protein [Terrilactibacillus tamarindi]MTT33172.1 nodulation protein NfeD [Terrilactibacillus tamarindi]